MYILRCVSSSVYLTNSAILLDDREATVWHVSPPWGGGVTQTISSRSPRKMMKAERQVVKADRGRLASSWDSRYYSVLTNERPVLKCIDQ